MGGDWHQLIQSILIGLIFSFLLAKLISFVTAFKDDNLSLSRQSRKQQSESGPDRSDYSPIQPGIRSIESSGELNDVSSKFSDDNSVLAERGSVAGGDSVLGDDESDDDWEGVESTELDEAFSAATTFVAAAAADKMAQKVANEVQLQLYGLYKIATEGPCSNPPPPAFKMTARAKWQAWQKLGAMPPEDAMQKYVDIVTELFPSWASGGLEKSKGGDGPQTSESRGPMGPVFSSFVHEEESGTDLKMDAIHAFAREGDVDSLAKCIDSGVVVNLKDSEGRTALHWAVDRGHLNVIELLCTRNADVNAKDNEGQTPLHYAVICDRESIAEFLVQQNADVNLRDNDGSTPGDISEKNWPWIRPKVSPV